MHTLTDQEWVQQSVARTADEVDGTTRTGLERWLDLATWLEIHAPGWSCRTESPRSRPNTPIVRRGWRDPRQGGER